MSFNLKPSPIAPGGSLTASGTGAKKRPARIRVASSDPFVPGKLLAEFKMPATGKFSRTLTAPEGPNRTVTIVLQQLRTDNVWAQTASADVLLRGIVGDPAPAPEPPPDPEPPLPNPDVTAPTITNIQAVAAAQGHTVSWDLDEGGTGQVQYGPTTSYGSFSTKETGFLTRHVQTIPALLSGWHYRVISADVYGNTRTSSDQTVPTPPVVPPPAPGAFPPNTTIRYITPNADTMPGYLSEITDSTWGVQIVRITNTTRSNSYPPRQPWNVGQTKIMLNEGGFRFLDASTYADEGVRGSDPGFADQPYWSNVDSDVMWGVKSGTINKYSYAGESFSAWATIAGWDYLSIGSGEGNISDDDHLVAFIANTESDQSGSWAVIAYDLVDKAVRGTLNLASQPNNCAVSRSGNYVIVQHGSNGTGNTQGTQLYDSSMNRIAQLATTRPHRDMGRNAAGEDVFVHISDDGTDVYSTRLSDRQRIGLFGGSGHIFGVGHVSCTNYDRDGWAGLSANSDITNSPGSGQNVAIKLDGSRVVEVFGFHHAFAAGDYDRSPHSAWSRDGTKCMFRSRWSPGTTVYSFISGMDV